MLRRAALPFAILTGIALFATPAVAATVHVSIQNFAFNPAMVAVAQGGTVTWTNNDGTAHTSTSNQGFWGSPHIAPGDTFSETKTFLNAGTYAYHCSIHTEMHGTVQVAMIKTGSAGSGWTVRWSSASTTPTGRNFDVRIKRPGSTSFTSFRGTSTALKTFFNPSRSGTYKFEARTRITNTGNTSGWSPVLTLTIS